MHDPLHRIYRPKVILVALSAAVGGVLLLFLTKYAESKHVATWLRDLPVFELGSTLFITGTLVIVWDYVDGRGTRKLALQIRGCSRGLKPPVSSRDLAM
jgi:hypothetical protein